MSFKVGDKVRVKFTGRIGYVVQLFHDEVVVEFRDKFLREGGRYKESDLEKVE